MTATQTQPLADASLPITLADVRMAHDRISGSIVRTPTLLSKTLSDITGAEVWLKFENLQFTAAYKERGALNKLLQLDEAARAKGVIAASAGNHAQGLAYHGRRLGIPVTIVMPVTTPIVKVKQTQDHGARVILIGERFEDASAHARIMEADEGLTYVHPFDDPDVMAGQGTIAIEMLEDAPDLDMIVVPVGGGGLISGVAIAAKAIKPDIRIVGVQSKLYPALYNLKNDLHIASGGDTLAEGIAVKNPGKLSSRVVLAAVDEMRIVNEAIIESAISLLLDVEKTVVEGAGAAGLATMLPTRDGNFRTEFVGKKVGVILTGGNIDSRFLANVILRNLARSGRIGRIAISLPDKVGALHEVSGIFTRHGANIIEVSHQRIFGVTSAKDMVTDIEYEIRDPSSLDQLQADLIAAGYSFEMMAVSGGRRSVRGARG